jgi:hypothetical protein
MLSSMAQKMNLSSEQIAGLAPDAASLAAGKKLGSPKSWKLLGQSPAAVWGECQGSALYQVRVDLADLAYKCSCPSRKLPCKHVLGLLFLAIGSAQNVSTGEPPEWVSEWLTKRAARAQQREEKKESSAPADPAAKAKRAEQRQDKVVDGVARLDLWLNDLMRNGLAGVEAQPPSFWEGAAKRLIDAQAPALAGRLRRIGEIPGTSPDWPSRLLSHLGRLALLIHAFRRLDSLGAGIQADIRQLIGWSVSQEELAGGEQATDVWSVVGQVIEQEDRLRVQRSWLLGEQTGRSALFLQFSAAGQPFPEAMTPGTRIEGDLVFWPSAFPQRAKFSARRGEMSRLEKCPSGLSSIEDFLTQVSKALAAQPWLERFLCVLTNVTPVKRAGSPRWLVCDSAGQSLPLKSPGSWKLLALSGGRPIDFAAEWNGERLLPLGAFAEDGFHVLKN